MHVCFNFQLWNFKLSSFYFLTLNKIKQYTFFFFFTITVFKSLKSLFLCNTRNASERFIRFRTEMFLNSYVFLSNQFPFNCYKTGLSLMYYEIIIRYGEHIRKIKLLDCFLITFVIYYWAVRISSIGIDYGFRYLHLHWNYRLRSSSHTSQMFFFCTTGGKSGFPLHPI